MSKADTLLKKATFFERLSLYGDRKSYLQALAQAEPTDQENIRLAQQALSILQQLGLDDTKTQALGNAVVFGKVDLAAMRREIQNAVLTGGISPLSHQNEINQLNQISRSFKAPMTETEQAMAGPADVTFKADKITGFAPISAEDQKAVFQFAVEVGELVPDPAKQQPDGRLGPETRKALEGVKNYFAKKNPQNPRMSDQQAIQAAKFKGR